MENKLVIILPGKDLTFAYWTKVTTPIVFSAITLSIISLLKLLIIALLKLWLNNFLEVIKNQKSSSINALAK